jgi:hypothetical protein
MLISKAFAADSILARDRVSTISSRSPSRLFSQSNGFLLGFLDVRRDPQEDGKSRNPLGGSFVLVKAV